MAILWFDGFDQYGTSSVSGSTILSRNYTVSSPGTASLVAGRFGVGYAVNPGIWINTLKKVTTNTDATLTVGIALKWIDPESDWAFLTIYDGASEACSIWLNATGKLALRVGSTEYDSSIFTVTLNTWYYFEFKIHCTSASNFDYELRMGGNTLFSGSNTHKGGTHTYVDTVSIMSANWKGSMVIDDYYITNGATGFLGNIRVQTLYPTGDTATVQWTPSTGTTHYNLVDENPANDDTDYIGDSVSGHVDLFDVGDSTYSPTILAVMEGVDCKDSAAPSTLQLECVSGGQTSDSANKTVPITSYTCVTNIWETDPGTSAAWTVSNFNAAQFGVKIP